MAAEIQSPDRPVQIRHQPRIREAFAIAVDYAEAAATPNSLRLFHRRTRPTAESDGDVAHRAQPSGTGDLPYAPVAALRERNAHWRGSSFDLAGRRSDRTGHHDSRH